jgi:hypothetical protein
MDKTIFEVAREVPVVHECDVVVIGGSCTGVFAAIRAARLGARVAIVEKENCFGGVATTSMVNVWHSLLDTEFNEPIIGGLTQEVIERLQKRNAIRFTPRSHNTGSVFNSEELKIELDEMVLENGIRPFFHTQFVAPHVEDQKLTAIIIENKSGRGAIKAAQFVDASGDGDLAARLGLQTYFSSFLQPATACARFANWETLDVPFGDALREYGEEFGLPQGFAWGACVPESPIFMLAATRVFGINPAEADDLTRGEIEGRRQVRAVMDILKKASPTSRLSLEALPSRLGLRESRHVRCGYQLQGEDILHGKRFDDAIANGSYRVDIHHQDKPGITLRYLDGTQSYNRPGFPDERTRWREETSENPTFYQVPLRSLVPDGPYGNIIVAGRMFDANEVAHAAVRVMVNMNQTGEAAGVAAFLALNSGEAVSQLDAQQVRKTLSAGGSIIF